MQVDEHGRKIVHADHLFAWYRRNLNTWPPHQHRMRRILAADRSEAR